MARSARREPTSFWRENVTAVVLFLALPRAVARFFVTRGIIARAEGTSLGGSEMLFSALVMRYVSEK